MTNFATMWLAAPDEIKVGFEPDGRQEWVCPGCLSPLMLYPPVNKDPRIRCYDCQGEMIAQQIPRLEQLLGMVKSKEWGLGPIDTEYAFSLDWTLSPSIFHAPTYEEAVLQGIAWEHGYKWTGEKWGKK